MIHNVTNVTNAAKTINTERSAQTPYTNTMKHFVQRWTSVASASQSHSTYFAKASLRSLPPRDQANLMLSPTLLDLHALPNLAYAAGCEMLFGMTGAGCW